MSSQQKILATGVALMSLSAMPVQSAWGTPVCKCVCTGREEIRRVYLDRLATVEKTYGADSLKAAVVWRLLGDLQRNSQCLEEAEQSYARAVQIQEKFNATNTAEFANDLESLSDLQFDKKKYAEAKAGFHRALSIYGRLERKLISNMLRCVVYLVDINNIQLNFRESERVVDDQLEKCCSSKQLFIEYIVLLEKTAYGLIEAHQLPEAERVIRKVLSLRAKASRSTTTAEIYAKATLAKVLMAEGKYQDAEPVCKELYDWSKTQPVESRQQIRIMYVRALKANNKTNEAQLIDKER